MATFRAPRIYFSLRSPYSWLAYRDLLSHHASVADLVEWIPFWEPDARSSALLTEAGGRWIYTPMSREKHLYILQDIRRLTHDRGLALTWPIDRDAVWEVPHLAYLYAHSHGLGRRFMDRVYRARWQEGQDICHPEVIGDLAGEVGLASTEAATAWQDQRWRAASVTPMLDAWSDGVFGVPFGVYKQHKFWGVDRIPAFAAALDGLVFPTAVPTPADSGVRVADRFDGGHEGGCG